MGKILHSNMYIYVSTLFPFPLDSRPVAAGFIHLSSSLLFSPLLSSAPRLLILTRLLIHILIARSPAGVMPYS